MSAANFPPPPSSSLILGYLGDTTEQTKSGDTGKQATQGRAYINQAPGSGIVVSLEELIVTTIESHKHDKTYIAHLNKCLHRGNFPSTDDLLIGNYMLEISRTNKLYKLLQKHQKTTAVNNQVTNNNIISTCIEPTDQLPTTDQFESIFSYKVCIAKTSPPTQSILSPTINGGDSKMLICYIKTFLFTF